MARVEDLNVWKESRKLNQEIYTHIISNTTFRDFPLQDQINRDQLVQLQITLQEGSTERILIARGESGILN